MEPTKEQIEIWHNDPKNWKWGMFYNNPEDPRMLVDKRTKWMGSTINFAHNRAVLGFFGALIGLLLLAGLTVYLAEMKK